MANIEKNIILGIDPGTIQMGYALIECTHKNAIQLISMGTLLLSSQKDMYARLEKIYKSIHEIINIYNPSSLAIEAPFFGKNVQSMLKLGRVQGIAIALAMYKQMSVTEYSPKKVKQSITGNGNASKEQVWVMLQKTFSLEQIPKYYDASDALAVALCHYYQMNSPLAFAKNKKNDWASFIEKNKDRIIK